MKIFKISFLVCFLTLVLHAEGTYVFEANGEAAKEMEQIMKKHSKDGNVTTSVYKKDKDGNLKPKSRVDADKQHGKELYAAKCASCHGANAEKKAYGESRALKKLSAEDIYISTIDYISAQGAGGKFKAVMQPIAAKTSETDLGYIIAYITGDDRYIHGGRTSLSKKNTDIDTKPSEQGSYLK